MIRKVLLTLLVAAMAAVMVRTWGSVGSVIMGFGLMTMAGSLLYQKFITNQDDPDYQMEV